MLRVERQIHTAGLGDPADQVAAALVAKEHLRDVYSAPGLRSARGRLAKFYAHCSDADVAELTRLAKTVRSWEAEILAYHRCGLPSNGPTEAVSLGIETVQLTGRGFRNFDNYRLRQLLALGVERHTRPAARIRSRNHASSRRACLRHGLHRAEEAGRVAA